MLKNIWLPIILSIVSLHATTPQDIATQDALAGEPRIAGAETTVYPEAEVGKQGNWRKKKDWLKQALLRNETIQVAKADIQKFSPIFQNKFSLIDKELTDFYQISGINKTEIVNMFTEIEQIIENTREKTKKMFALAMSQIDTKDQTEAKQIKTQYADLEAVEEKFKTYRNNFEQLKLDIQAIIDLEKSLRDRLTQINTYMKNVQSDSEEARKLSQKIWYVIDDLKARDMFYTLDEINEKTKNLQQFIKNECLNDFTSVIKTVEQQMKKISSELEAIEKEGLVAISKAAKINQANKKQTEALQKQKTACPVKQPSWYENIFYKIKSGFLYIASLFGYDTSKQPPKPETKQPLTRLSPQGAPLPTTPVSTTPVLPKQIR